MIYPKAAAGENGAAVPARPRFPEIEERVLRYWEKSKSSASPGLMMHAASRCCAIRRRGVTASPGRPAGFNFENDYKTLDSTYMESVMWAFKELYDKGLVYEGFRCLPYCWNDETPLSAHELRMDDDVYQLRQDPAVTVGCQLETGELALLWTTTPWTLPSNLAVAVRGDIDYVVAESDVTGRNERYLLGGFILLNTAVTPELAAEGLARDVVRVVQQARRAAGLGVSDRISLTIAGTPAVQQAIRMHQQLIAGETLATAVEMAGPGALDDDPQAGEPAVVGENETIRIRLTA